MSTQVFAANNASYRQRRRAHRACDQCKRRRRRCEPPFENHDRCAGCTRDGIACSLVPADPNPPNPTPISSASSLADIDDPSSPRPRFVGDLNPESVFLTSSAASQQRDLTECGVWATATTGPQPRRRHVPRNIPQAYLAYLDSIGAFSLPPPAARDELIVLYLRSVHPMLPILDVPAFLAAHAASTVSIPLLHAVLLVAARHPCATPYLPSMSARTFASATAEKVTALLHGGIERDRITLTRIYALLSLHSEGPTGNETASLQLSTAVHHAYSLGLHLNRAQINKDEQRLWWCLWALDAQQASLCGRPVGVRREDVSIPFPGDDTAGGDFVTCLRITEILARVIALYRPSGGGGGGRTTWGDCWTAFENVHVRGSTGEVKDTLHLFYHAVSILSHRDLPSSTAMPSSSPPTATYHRRIHSAHAILALFAQKKLFSPLPIVPYTLSLALTSFYSVLRSAVGGDAERAGFSRVCEMLEGLGMYWWFAGAMAQMGRQAMERVRAREAAGVLRRLKGGDFSDGGGGGEVEEIEVDAVETWFVQLFPDLAVPTGLFGDAFENFEGGSTGGEMW